MKDKIGFVLLGCFFLEFASLGEEISPIPGGSKGIRIVGKNAQAVVQWTRKKRFALIIGISDYEDLKPFPKNADTRTLGPGPWDLEFADNDARTISKFFKNVLGYDKVTVLIGKDATLEKILSAIKTITESAEPGDTVVLYLSGHGFKVGEKYWFMAYDTKYELIGMGQAIDLNESVVKKLEECRATHKLLVLDSCHSGGTTTSEATLKKGILSRAVDPGELPVEGVYILTSCKKGEFSYEDRRTGMGYLTRFFLEALQDGAADGYVGNADGFVSAEEVYTYVLRKLPPVVKKETNGGVQTPTRKAPQVGTTYIACFGIVQQQIRLQSVPQGARVVVTETRKSNAPSQPGATIVDGTTPLTITLRVGQSYTVEVIKEGFNKWTRKWMPTSTESVKETAVLERLGVGTGAQNYKSAIALYGRGKRRAAIELLEDIITRNAADAPRALRFLILEHHLKRKKISEAIALANKLRANYPVSQESTDVDKALYRRVVSRLEQARPTDPDGIRRWHKRYIDGLNRFIKKQPMNRFVTEARVRIKEHWEAICRSYKESYEKLMRDSREKLAAVLQPEATDGDLETYGSFWKGNISKKMKKAKDLLGEQLFKDATKWSKETSEESSKKYLSIDDELLPEVLENMLAKVQQKYKRWREFKAVEQKADAFIDKIRKLEERLGDVDKLKNDADLRTQLENNAENAEKPFNEEENKRRRLAKLWRQVADIWRDFNSDAEMYRNKANFAKMEAYNEYNRRNAEADDIKYFVCFKNAWFAADNAADQGDRDAEKKALEAGIAALPADCRYRDILQARLGGTEPPRLLPHPKRLPLMTTDELLQIVPDAVRGTRTCSAKDLPGHLGYLFTLRAELLKRPDGPKPTWDWQKCDGDEKMRAWRELQLAYKYRIFRNYKAGPRDYTFRPDHDNLVFHMVWIDNKIDQGHKQAKPPGFFIDKYEVTVGQFRAFYENRLRPKRGYPKWKLRLADVMDNLENKRHPDVNYPDDWPVVLVSYHEANDFAAWSNNRDQKYRRLPALSEWRRAAYVDPKTDKEMQYPWGTEAKKAWNLRGKEGLDLWDKIVAPVFFENGDCSRWGVVGMAGNVREWVTWGAMKERQYVLGSDYMNSLDRASSFTRVRRERPNTRDRMTGFRCVFELPLDWHK